MACKSCGKMKCSCGGMAHDKKKKMARGGMAMREAMQKAREMRGAGKRPISSPGFRDMAPPKDMEKMPVVRKGRRFAGKPLRNRMDMSEGGMVRRKGTCGKNS